MKKKVSGELALMALAVILLAPRISGAADDVPPDVFPAESVILFQGDSITHGGRRNDMNHFMGHGYQAEIAMRYLAAYPRKGLKFLNRGISGDTTEKLLARWERDAVAPVGDEVGYGREFGYTNEVVSSSIPLRPDYLSILVGVNDHDKGVSAETYSSNLVQLVDRALTAHPKLKIVLGEPFRHPHSDSPRYAQMQAFVRRFAKERGFAFVPYQSLFDGKLAKLNPDPAYWSWDGGHPTYAAHLHMANLWIETVAAFYGRSSAAHAGLEPMSGGVALVWTKPAQNDRLLQLVLPEVRSRIVTAVVPGEGEIAGFGDDAPVQLYDRGVRLPLSRWPKTGRLMVAAEGPKWSPHDKSFVRPKSVTVASAERKDRLAQWVKEPDLWFWGAWRYGWNDSTERALRIDPEKGTFEIGTAGILYGVSKGCTDGGWYQARNALCDLREPGEWAVDRKSRRIYLVEPEGGASGVIVALKETALRLEGVCDRTIEGKVFEACRRSAIVLRSCTNVVIRRSVIRNTGGSGVEMHNCRNCRIEGCDLYDIGECGVDIRGGGVRDALEPGGNAVVNCHIHHYGQVKHNYRPGVYLRYGVGNRVEHCLIHHAKHAGVVFEGNDHYVGWNVIHDVCKDNYDCGAIYTHTIDAWWARGTVVERNLVHAVGKGKGAEHTMAYYVDGWSSGVIVRDNIASWANEAYFQSGGNDNTFVRNIAVNCSKSIVHSNLGLCGGSKPFPGPRPGVSLGRESLLFKGLERNKALFSNPLWTGRYPNMMRVYEFADARRAHDSLFAVITNNVWAWSADAVFQDRELMEGYQMIANNVRVDDPGFVDYEGLDFELKPDSPVRMVIGGGTRFAEMGLYDSPARVSKAVKFGDGVSRPPKQRGSK